MSYFMFPTEALLLGECLGEHEVASQREDESGRGYFLDIVRRRVLPMMPSLIQHKLDEELGPVIDDSRKSLLDLILHELGDSVSKSGLDRVLGLAPEAAKLAHLYQSILELDPNCAAANEATVALKRSTADETPAIAALLSTCARESRQEQLFSLGRSFGQAIAEVEEAIEALCELQFEGVFADQNSGFQYSLMSYLRPGTLSALAKELQEAVPGIGHAFLIQAESLVTFDYEVDYATLRPVVHANQILGGIWLAFGEALGAVRETDGFFRMQDAESPTPRAFRITIDSSPDAIRQALKDCDLSLNDAATGAASAERIVRELSHAIEALARQLWPDSSLSRGVRPLLHDKLKTTTSLEQRFASVALTLYTNYRNPASHDYSFQCSFAEARFYVAGIRSLLDMTDRIRTSRT